MALSFEQLVKKIIVYNPSFDTDKFKHSLELLKEKDQKHPNINKNFYELGLGFLDILVDLNMDSETLYTAALYYPFVWNKINTDDVKKISKEIAPVLEKLKKYRDYELSMQTKDDMQKLILAMTKDPRIIIIRLAKHVLYLRERENETSTQRKAYAQASFDIYTPIAHKIGMYNIKSELEDLSFKELEPEIYNEIQKKLEILDRETQILKVKARVEQELEKSGIKTQVYGRPKHIYSIWKKMQRKNKPFEEILDLTGLRIVTETEKECYTALGIVHSLYSPISGEFDDYIAKPKENMYQSLHTTLMGEEKKPFEIQIRTREMHKIAEYGIAVHWKYKGIQGQNKWDKKLSWMKQMMEWREDIRKSKEFMDTLKTDFFEDEIFVFTPKKQVIELPGGSTPLDFAYAIHTDVGHKCHKAKVNGILVPLDHELQSGDNIEILTSEKQEPKRAWLTIVKTSKAKSKIRQKLEIQGIEKKVQELRTGRSLKITSAENSNIKLGRCCLPIPGDQVIGYYTTKRKTVVHRKDCQNSLKQKNSNRIVEVDWAVKGSNKFMAEVKVECLDRPGILSDILGVFTQHRIGIKSTDAKTVEGTKSRAMFAIETPNIEQLQKLLDNLTKVKGVTNVERA